MQKQATAIRFSQEERSWIQAYADIHGQSFSEVVRNAALEKVEDALDRKLYLEAISNDDGKRYDLEEIIEELG